MPLMRNEESVEVPGQLDLLDQIPGETRGAKSHDRDDESDDNQRRRG